MKLLKSFGEDEIEMKVVSFLDFILFMYNKSVIYFVGMQKMYFMICLVIDDDDKIDKIKKIFKKFFFLSWGINKNRQKLVSILCFLLVGVVWFQVKKKLLFFFSFFNLDSFLY